MALDFNTALNSYGFVGTVANAIPELRTILNQAIAGEWAPEQFTRTVNDSQWFKTNAESVRKLATMQAMDPATYQQNLANATSKIELMARQLGVIPNGPDLAIRALLGNWDDQQLRSAIASSGTYQHPGTWSAEGGLGGEAAQLGNHMKELATNYGVAFTDDWIAGSVRHIQAGQDTIDGWEAVMRARAKAQFPHLAAQIDAGMTVRDIADPYIAQYAKTLELAESSVNLTDPTIMKALQSKNPDGTFTAKPMYEFVRQLKDDPRWDKTKNAEDEAYRFASSIGKSMGFVS